jgi:hypothetical protein
MATTPSTTASSSSQPSPHDTSSGSKMVTSTTFANSLDWIGTPATAASFAASVPVGTTATSVSDCRGSFRTSDDIGVEFKGVRWS